MLVRNAGQPCHIMVVREGHQVFAPVNAPGICSELTMQGMGDLEQVHGIETGVKSFVALIVGTAVKHVVGDNLVIVTE